MSVNIPNPPPGACVPGRTLIYAVVCDPSGEGYGSGEWIDSAELAGGSIQGVAGVAAIIKPHGCGCSGADAPAVIAATVDAVKAGYEMGLRAAAK